MAFGRPNLGRILVKNGVISMDQLESALEYQITHGCRLGEALVGLQLCTDGQIAHSLAEQLEIPFVDLAQTPPDPDVINMLSREMALEHGVLPIRMEGNRLLVAVRDPFNIQLDDVLRQALGRGVITCLAPESQLRDALHQHYSVSAYDEPPALARSGDSNVELDLEENEQVSVEKLIAAGEQLSTIQVVNALIADAVRRHASDLHIKPEDSGIKIRYRVDGKMSTVALLQRSLLQSLVARIKIMCSMDIAENRKPQDGNCRVRVQGRAVELRASTLPGIFGEIVVMRILSPDAAVQDLNRLGFIPDTLDNYRRLLCSKNGMIIVTGPTGSGKTSTLYATLSHLNKDDVNIITVEDPVEVKLAGIGQVQVDDKAGRTFAGTLRSMLRQDPDIIMVGEIRDAETADIACRAALTGHLVLSTLHTRHAFGTIARLQDLGVAPYMLAAALNGVIAQRLARRICEHCAEPYEPSPLLLKAFESAYGIPSGARFQKGAGCPRCHYNGTRGRIGVHELLVVDEDLRRLLTDGAAPSLVKKYAEEAGFRTMENDAFLKACEGLIPPEEVLQLGLGLTVGDADVDAVLETAARRPEQSEILDIDSVPLSAAAVLAEV